MFAVEFADKLTPSMAKGAPSTPVLIAYALFAAAGVAIFHFVGEGEFSSILTLSVMIQCLGVCLLAIQVVSSNSAAGISVRALVLDAVAISMRLSSTTWFNGYLPVDATGDVIFQSLDVLSLVVCLWLIYHIKKENRSTYQESEDSCPIALMVVVSLVLAALFHGDLDDRPFFDTMWMAGLFIGVFAVVPQLWLITQTGGKADALTSHYIAMMAMSRFLSGLWMWHAKEDISCKPWVEGYSHAIWFILGAHAIHLILLGDFAYYYAKAVATQGVNCHLDLNEGQWV